jgi:hypothetical protein
MISFAPLGNGAARPVSVGAVIRDGNYSIERTQGPVPGSYRVAIMSEGGDPATSEVAPGPGELKTARKEPIPARYNASTTLKADVTEGGSNAFDYELTSK